MDEILLTIVFIGAPIALSIGIPLYAYMCAKDNEIRNRKP